MQNDGEASFQYLLWNPFLQPPPDFSGLQPGDLVRVRNTFPSQGRDVLETLVYLLRPNVPVEIPISLFYLQVEEIKLSAAQGPSDSNTIAFSGRISSNPVQFPFGMIVGKPCVIGGAFDQAGPSTQFKFFGGLTVGSHATLVPEATGHLTIKTPWNSF